MCELIRLAHNNFAYFWSEVAVRISQWRATTTSPQEGPSTPWPGDPLTPDHLQPTRRRDRGSALATRRPTSPAEAEEIWDDLWHQEAHHSTALEGNTLILSEVRKLLDEGRAVGSKELKEYMEVVGYGAAAKWVWPGDGTG